jgi:PAS domain-containing protein
VQSREQLVEALEALRLRVRELEERNRELARSERGMRAELARMGRSMQAAGVGAWEWNQHTNVAVWSEGNYRILGLEPGSVEARYENWICRVHPEDRADAERYVGEAVAGQRHLSLLGVDVKHTPIPEVMPASHEGHLERVA